MDEFTADAFVNRNEPIPVLTIRPPTNDPASSDDNNGKGKRERLKASLSGTTSRLKDKVQESTSGTKDYGYSLQDRLFSKLLQQVIPQDEVDELDLPPDVRSSKYINRPSFSIPLMTSNFRRFNARVGVVFVFQNRLERLLTWRQPSHTLSLLAVCTFVCLDPYLLSVLPLVGILFFVMMPAYIARHPPPPTPAAMAQVYSLTGPPLAPARTIKPASEMSKDFFRNMRDLQNSMDDFSTIHDTLVRYITPPINFSNEALSSTIFVFLFLASCMLFLIAHQLPWRLLALLICWTGIGLGHPTIQQLLLSNYESHVLHHEKHAKSWLDTWTAHDIILDAPPELREVEIFELQRRQGGRNGEWEGWIFSPTPYDPLSPQRISGHRPRGTRFFEDVSPPKGWEWEDKMWALDLASRDWVEERMVQRVEVEVDGERWVSDLATESTMEDDDEEGMGGSSGSPGRRGKGSKVIGPGWEEGDGGSRMGEWRRRRWIRLVRRQVMNEHSVTGSGAL